MIVIQYLTTPQDIHRFVKVKIALYSASEFVPGAPRCHRRPTRSPLSVDQSEYHQIADNRSHACHGHHVGTTQRDNTCVTRN
ncbi:hypothetical protein Zmor_018872 [Zophobas morio]|uniref:Uncharacterized protein n=1 Tax=Zophobas morio TaxID=2755281 RepID=A0AA38IFI5_9CUCU|nr:hypothetical protein Zmor_018872 [Zophobas morio]